MNRRLSLSWAPSELNPRYWLRTQEKEVKASEGHGGPICFGKCILSRGLQGTGPRVAEFPEARAKEDPQEESIA